MPYQPDHHHRQSVRLRDFDYARGGGYFVTLCAWQRECLFGDVHDVGMRLNDFGMVVGECWAAIPEHFPHVQLDAFVVMPNHVHGVLLFDHRHSAVGAQHAAPLQWAAHKMPEPMEKRGITPNNVIPGSLGAVVRSFKSAVTKRINTMRDNPGCPVWQRNYHEHVIRDERDLYAIRQYIADNPAKWALDDNHPTRI
ncbi:transposase [Trichloromonas acetexigens]|uniref:Transposase n=1 Tax=Trichloromonas acetexigens TaxID=38815 RepID=A0A550J969_9BACT|nr:transposase [Desulfuromonas acetexigens]TRO79784.1 transposase [Desulfuromonas acetexigens]